MILVTGGSGFLGKHVCEQLTEQGFSVVDASLQPQKNSRYPSQAVDISKLANLEEIFSTYKIERIIHLAAWLHTESWKNPADAYRVNVQGSFYLLELARQYGVQRFVFGSTLDALGYHAPEEGAVDENAEVLPSDLYGETKRFIEKLGVSYQQMYGLDFISARIPLIVGPGEATPTSAWRMEIFNLLQCGGEIDFGFEPQAILPIAHVVDSALEICKLATATTHQHAIYHLPCECIRVSTLAEEVERIGKNIHTKFGSKKADFFPTQVNFSRFQTEFKLTHTPLFTRLEKFAGKS